MDIRAPEAMANLERVMERSLRQRIISSLEESDCQSCQGVSLCHGQA
jgi:radical SAM protein with 4Fe4S-binding SPASM domain